jgi:hypothetical protein
MAKTDWSTAGKRLRRTEQTPAHGGRNPDWNQRLSRWKVAEEYAGETLTVSEVQQTTCPVTECYGMYGHACTDARNRLMDSPHPERVFAAGAKLIAGGWKL